MIGAADTFGDDSNDSISSYRSDGGRNFEIHVTVEPRLETIDIPLPEPVLNYTIIPKGTIQGQPLLCDGLGFRYGIWQLNKTTWNWACTHRNTRDGRVPCRVTVSQKVFFTAVRI